MIELDPQRMHTKLYVLQAPQHKQRISPKQFFDANSVVKILTISEKKCFQSINSKSRMWLNAPKITRKLDLVLNSRIIKLPQTWHLFILNINLWYTFHRNWSTSLQRCVTKLLGTYIFVYFLIWILAAAEFFFVLKRMPILNPLEAAMGVWILMNSWCLWLCFKEQPLTFKKWILRITDESR